MNKNPYEVLGVGRDAADADIKKAYHKLVMKHHPDKNQGDKTAEEKFKEINNAFDVLRDPQKRAAYDRFGDAAFAGGNTNGGFGGAGANPFADGGFQFNMGGGMGGMDDIIREAMRGFGFGAQQGGATASARGGRDLLDEAVIDLKDAYFGITHTVKFSSDIKCEKCNGNGTGDGKPAPACARCRGSGVVHTQRGFFAMESPCPDCNGLGRQINKKCSDCDGTGTVHKHRTLDVKIPAGIEDGARLRLSGQGEAGPNGGPSGDFYLDVRIRPDKVFQRNGVDLLIRTAVPFTTLALGGDIEIKTIDDKKLSVKVSAGTQVGEKLRVRGNGMPTGRSGGFGDLYIDVVINIPTKLSDKQKKALGEYADMQSDNKKGWF